MWQVRKIIKIHREKQDAKNRNYLLRVEEGDREIGNER